MGLLAVMCGWAEETEEAHEWLVVQVDPTCTEDGFIRRTCVLCGYETVETLPATGHQWTAVSYTEPTCTQNGVAIRRCEVCGLEDRLETPALPHCYVWTEIIPPSGQGDGLSALQCVLCGDIAETQVIHPVEILYNNTITSYGPATRDLIGGSVWNRVTPIDLSADGVYTYPLIASDCYTVGTAMVVIEGSTETVSYSLSSDEIQIHSESLVVYPDLNALRTGENAVSFPFNQPIDIAAAFDGDTLVILSITLKADYNILDDGVQYFSPDESQIATMTGLLD